MLKKLDRKLEEKAQKLLLPSEKIIKIAQYSNIDFLPAFALSVFILLGVFVSDNLEDTMIMLLGVVFTFVLFSLPPILKRLRNFLVVTNNRIVGKRGLIKTNELTSPLKQIQNVQVKYGFIGRLFKIGAISITTTSGVYIFKGIYKPNEFKDCVMSQIENTEYDKMDVHAGKIADAIYRRNQE